MDILSKFILLRKRAAEWLEELEQSVRPQLEFEMFEMHEIEAEIRISPKNVEGLNLDLGVPDEPFDPATRTARCVLEIGADETPLYLDVSYFAADDRFTISAETDMPVKKFDPYQQYALENFRVPLNDKERDVSRAEAVEHVVRIAKIFQALAVQRRGGGTVIEGGI